MIEILTDSTCDLPQPLLEQYRVTVLPHVIIWGGRQYRDRVDLQPEEFYRRLQSEANLPTTSAIPVPEFIHAYQAARARGASEVLAVMINSAFSGAYQNALTAAAQVDLPVKVFDTRSTTMSLGWLVLEAARLRDAGAAAADILARLAEVRRRMYLHVCLDTLEFVQRGGRIGKAARLVGTLLQIKPVLDVDARSGEVVDIATTRTRRRAVEEFYCRFFERVDPSKPCRVAVTHGAAPEEAAELIERIRREVRPLEIITEITSPVLGINTGPRALALAGYNE